MEIDLRLTYDYVAFVNAARELERELERENAALREENAEWREMIREAVFDNNDILYWIRGARSILLDAVEKDRAAYAARKEAKP